MADPGWADHVPDQVHQLDLCPGCEGLRVATLDRLPGVLDVTLNGPGGRVIYSGPAVVHVGPAPDTCPTAEHQEGERHG
jgi:hypothetical protein